MIQSIADRTTQDIFDGTNSKTSRRLPLDLHTKARRLLDLINAAGNINDLRIPPGNRLETLRGDLKGFHGVRINDQWRVIFQWIEGDAHDVQIVDYH